MSKTEQRRELFHRIYFEWNPESHVMPLLIVSERYFLHYSKQNVYRHPTPSSLNRVLALLKGATNERR